MSSTEACLSPADHAMDTQGILDLSTTWVDKDITLYRKPVAVAVCARPP